MAASIETTYDNGIAAITFFHPQSNSFTSKQLQTLAQLFDKLSQDSQVKIILLQSLGKTFCAGASFDELLAVTNQHDSVQFFEGFGKLLNSMKNCSKPIITKVQGRAVGGGVGIICASDYVIASENAEIKLSELSIGFGPFVIEPIITKKTGPTNFYHMTLSPLKWFNANECIKMAVFNEITSDELLTSSCLDKAKELLSYATESTAELKKIYWAPLNDYEHLFPQRATISARLAQSAHTQSILTKFKEKK